VEFHLQLGRRVHDGVGGRCVRVRLTDYPCGPFGLASDPPTCFASSSLVAAQPVPQGGTSMAQPVRSVRLARISAVQAKS